MRTSLSDKDFTLQQVQELFDIGHMEYYDDDHVVFDIPVTKEVYQKSLIAAGYTSEEVNLLLANFGYLMKTVLMKFNNFEDVQMVIFGTEITICPWNNTEDVYYRADSTDGTLWQSMILLLLAVAIHPFGESFQGNVIFSLSANYQKHKYGVDISKILCL